MQGTGVGAGVADFKEPTDRRGGQMCSWEGGARKIGCQQGPPMTERGRSG